MSLLISIKQRIKAVETIKKIAHAMRLISMSAHAQLKAKEGALVHYKKTLTSLLSAVHPEPTEKQSISDESVQKTELVILIGSQKGLCGNFNLPLHYLFEEHIKQINYPFEVITVGKKAHEYVTGKKKITPLVAFDQLTTTRYHAIAEKLYAFIVENKQFQTVTVISTIGLTFFNQKPTVTQLIPFVAQTNESQPAKVSPDIAFEQDREHMINFISDKLLKFTIEQLIFQSLSAEQAARFVSMDSATRNADNLLDQTRLTYNKLRQAIITKELAELTGSGNLQ